MLVFSQWRPELGGDGCRVPRWVPVERFAPYVARSAGTRVLPPSPPQVEDEESCPSPPSPGASGAGGAGGEAACAWRGCAWGAAGAARLAAHVARAHARPHADGLFYCGWRGCSRPHKGFNARYKMLVHVRTHTNERPHTCNQCQKSFSRAENLKIHLRSHSGEKPYVCSYEGCGKAYSNSSDRFKHTRTHTVDKPYCCKVVGCNKRYTDPSSLRKHVKTYKHFTPRDPPKQDSSDDARSPDSSRHSIDKTYNIEPLSPAIIYSPSRTISPNYSHIMPMANTLSPGEYKTDQITYMRPLEPYLRIPPPEMSYLEYSQMYEHAYRSYYTNNYAYPVRPAGNEKSYCYEQPRIENVIMETDIDIVEEDMPLNLKCERRMEEPIELVRRKEEPIELERRADLPLDLSIRIDVESL